MQTNNNGVKMNAFGIFEGGGAKGLAHVGALKAAEEKDIKFIGVAGTSAGAILASLLAVGYTSEQLYNPENQSSIFSKDFLSFFSQDWNKFEKAKSSLKSLLKTKCAFAMYLKVIPFYISNYYIIQKLKVNHGVFNTQNFENYINDCLYKKLNV
jgi:NTE family protein